VRCASAGAERPEGGLRAGPAYVVIPQAQAIVYWLLIVAASRFSVVRLQALVHYFGYCLLSIGYCLLSIGYWLLSIVYCLLSIGYWLLSIDYCLLAIVAASRFSVAHLQALVVLELHQLRPARVAFVKASD
jgi:hypothetical protein